MLDKDFVMGHTLVKWNYVKKKDSIKLIQNLFSIQNLFLNFFSTVL